MPGDPVSPPDPAAVIDVHLDLWQSGETAASAGGMTFGEFAVSGMSSAGLTPLPDGHTRIDGHSYTLERYVVYAGEWVYRLRPFDATDPNIVPSQADGETR